MVRLYPTPEQIALHKVEPGLHWSLLDEKRLIGSGTSVATQKDLLYEAIEAQSGNVIAEIELPIKSESGVNNQKLILVEGQEGGGVIKAVRHFPDKKSLELFPLDENADGPKWYPVNELPIGNAEETLQRLDAVTFAIKDQNAHIQNVSVDKVTKQDGSLTTGIFFRVETSGGRVVKAGPSMSGIVR